MSLNWSTENVKYFKDHPDELWTKINVGMPGEQEDLNVETKSLVFGSMALGIGSISYKNAPDFYARWKVFEKYDNFYLYSVWDGEETVKTYLTPQVVVKHFGLSTNVSTESETVWAKRIAKGYAQDHARGYRDTLVTEKEIRAIIRDAKNEFENSFIKTDTVGE
jgi:hypothetical protein